MLLQGTVRLKMLNERSFFCLTHLLEALVVKKKGRPKTLGSAILGPSHGATLFTFIFKMEQKYLSYHLGE